MFSNYRLDNVSVDIFSRAMFTRADKDKSDVLEIYDVKNILSELYKSTGNPREISDEDVRSFLRANNTNGHHFDLKTFTNFNKEFIGITRSNQEEYDLIKKDLDIANLTKPLNKN